MYWIFNGYLFLFSPLKNKRIAYLLSFIFAYISNIFKVVLGEGLYALRSTMVEYIVYPLLIMLVLNSVVLMIIHSVIRLEEK